MSDLLYQRKVWTTREGVTMALKEMTPDHRRNLLRYFERRAAAMKDSEEWKIALGPIEPPEEYFDHMFSATPQEWLSQLPLYKALRKLVCKDAMTHWMGEQ